MLLKDIPRADALQAIRFIPLAFARDVLNGMGVTLSDTYIRVAGESSEERPLNDEPFYREALELAPHMAAQFGFDTFNAVVFLSPGFQAINAAAECWRLAREPRRLAAVDHVTGVAAGAGEAAVVEGVGVKTSEGWLRFPQIG